jgi:hypothetical protein
MNAASANERFIAMKVEEEHTEYYDDGGEFLPLTVWATRGFDVTNIAEKCRPQDKRSHPVLGDTYRIAILKSGHRGHKGGSKTDTLSAQSTAASSSGLAVPSLLAIGDRQAESGSSSSDDSSDSSASKKKSKKSKKSKKAKKAKKDSKKEKKAKKATELKRKRDVEEAKASVSSTSCVGDYR